MSHFGDFMDGVPVKISEKYKRPPRIELPYTVNECPIRAQNAVDSANYCTTFESNVLAKLKELRSAKETKKNERRHRLQLLEEAKQKKLDAIAVAEDEQRLKQLSVSEVSYPSTEEISALSPDEKAEKTCDIPAITDNTNETTINDAKFPVCSNPTDSQMNILQPVQVKCNYQENNSLMDDPISDPLQNLRLHSKVKAVPYSRNVEALTFRDFENDTSSPFDNVELKTINEMELLAQVLQSQLESSNSCNQQQRNVTDMYYGVPNCSSQAHVEGVAYMPNTYAEQPGQGPSMMYAAPQHYPTNGYYISTENENMYMPNYQYYVPTPYQTVNPYYQMPTTSDVQGLNGSMHMTLPYYCQHPQVPVDQPPTYNMPVENQESHISSQNTIKSRSRSVPDIVRELNLEIDLAKQRVNELSLNTSPTPKSIPHPVPTSSGKKEERRHRKKSEQLPNPYDKLSPKLQEMCKNIHGMGFPLDRVARICTLVGDNDKKVSI